MSSSAPLTVPRAGTATIRHELSFLNAFRLVQALVYVGLAFSPPGLGWPELATPDFARAVATAYLMFALVALLFNRRSMPYARTVVATTLAADITAAV
ncbi:two-component sensor histidine kinase, partial [Rhodanobacter denitrificans]|nr:two-component sensor histidine kinase [Rhodanobacter denitrificans]